MKIDDINKLLIDHELTDNKLVYLMPEAYPADEYISDLELVPFTAENIYKALQLDTKLNWNSID